MLIKIVGRLIVALAAPLALANHGHAQIVAPASATRVATLEDQLINRLKATTEDRQAYIRLVVAKTEAGIFDRGRILAFERYAMRKNPQLPFPYFERVMRVEAERVGEYLPPVRMLAGVSYKEP